MSVYDHEENAVVNNAGGISETPSNLVNNNLDNLVKQDELDELLQYKEKSQFASKLSPNPAGFGFTSQVFLDQKPTGTGQPNVLYIEKVKNDGIVVGYRLWKWYPRTEKAEAHYGQYGATPDLELENGPRERPVHENNAPKEKPEKVFTGRVVFNGPVEFKGKSIEELGGGSGGGSVQANPELEGDEEELSGIEIDGVKYKVVNSTDVGNAIEAAITGAINEGY